MKIQDLINNGYENVIVLRNPDYDGCIIGVTTDQRAVYSLKKMVQFLMKDDMTEEDARDFIDYNTIGSLGADGYPIVLEYEDGV